MVLLQVLAIPRAAAHASKIPGFCLPLTASAPDPAAFTPTWAPSCFTWPNSGCRAHPAMPSCPPRQAVGSARCCLTAALLAPLRVLAALQVHTRMTDTYQGLLALGGSLQRVLWTLMLVHPAGAHWPGTGRHHGPAGCFYRTAGRPQPGHAAGCQPLTASRPCHNAAGTSAAGAAPVRAAHCPQRAVHRTQRAHLCPGPLRPGAPPGHWSRLGPCHAPAAAPCFGSG